MLSILSTVKQPWPKLPYEKMKTDILGATYELSLVFVGKDRGRTINQTFRKKDYVPNVLAFPLEKNVGEIIITPAVAKREAKTFGRNFKDHVAFLYIHALLHLKGHDHGSTMEALERKYCTKYQIN